MKVSNNVRSESKSLNFIKGVTVMAKKAKPDFIFKDDGRLYKNQKEPKIWEFPTEQAAQTFCDLNGLGPDDVFFEPWSVENKDYFEINRITQADKKIEKLKRFGWRIDYQTLLNQYPIINRNGDYLTFKSKIDTIKMLTKYHLIDEFYPFQLNLDFHFNKGGPWIILKRIK